MQHEYGISEELPMFFKKFSKMPNFVKLNTVYIIFFLNEKHFLLSDSKN